MKFLKNLQIKDKILIAFAAIILALGGLLKFQHDKTKQAESKLQYSQANIKALQDSVRITKQQNVVDYNKFAFLVKDINELKQLNNELAAEVKATKGTVIAIQKATYSVIHDTVSVPTTSEVSDSVITIKGNYEKQYSQGNFRKLGFSTHFNQKDYSSSAEITKDEIGFTAVTGLKESKDGYEIFVRPQYPNMTISKLEGAYINKSLFQAKDKPKLITLGVNVGWVPFTYDVIKKKTAINLGQVGVGAGVNFNINRLLNK